MPKLPQGVFSFTLQSHSDLLDVVSSPEVREITLGGYALIPFIELFDFASFSVPLCKDFIYGSMLFDCLSSNQHRAEFLHRMNEFYSTTLQETIDWFVIAEQVNDTHIAFYRGVTIPFLEFVLNDDNSILFKLHSL